MGRVIYHKLLSRIVTITAEGRHKRVILQHEKLTSQDFAWKIMHHSPCSPDFAPLDFHLYRTGFEEPPLITMSPFETSLVNYSLSNHRISSEVKQKNCRIVGRQSYTYSGEVYTTYEIMYYVY